MFVGILSVQHLPKIIDNVSGWIEPEQALRALTRIAGRYKA